MANEAARYRQARQLRNLLNKKAAGHDKVTEEQRRLLEAIGELPEAEPKEAGLLGLFSTDKFEAWLQTWEKDAKEWLAEKNRGEAQAGPSETQESPAQNTQTYAQAALGFFKRGKNVEGDATQGAEAARQEKMGEPAGQAVERLGQSPQSTQQSTPQPSAVQTATGGSPQQPTTKPTTPQPSTTQRPTAQAASGSPQQPTAKPTTPQPTTKPATPQPTTKPTTPQPPTPQPPTSQQSAAQAASGAPQQPTAKPTTPQPSTPQPSTTQQTTVQAASGSPQPSTPQPSTAHNPTTTPAAPQPVAAQPAASTSEQATQPQQPPTLPAGQADQSATVNTSHGSRGSQRYVQPAVENPEGDGGEDPGQLEEGPRRHERPSIFQWDDEGSHDGPLFSRLRRLQGHVPPTVENAEDEGGDGPRQPEEQAPRLLPHTGFPDGDGEGPRQPEGSGSPPAPGEAPTLINVSSASGTPARTQGQPAAASRTRFEIPDSTSSFPLTTPSVDRSGARAAQGHYATSSPATSEGESTEDGSDFSPTAWEEANAVGEDGSVIRPPCFYNCFRDMPSIDRFPGLWHHITDPIDKKRKWCLLRGKTRKNSLAFEIPSAQGSRLTLLSPTIYPQVSSTYRGEMGQEVPEVPYGDKTMIYGIDLAEDPPKEICFALGKGLHRNGDTFLIWHNDREERWHPKNEVIAATSGSVVRKFLEGYTPEWNRPKKAPGPPPVPQQQPTQALPTEIPTPAASPVARPSRAPTDTIAFTNRASRPSFNRHSLPVHHSPQGYPPPPYVQPGPGNWYNNPGSLHGPPFYDRPQDQQVPGQLQGGNWAPQYPQNVWHTPMPPGDPVPGQGQVVAWPPQVPYPYPHPSLYQPQMVPGQMQPVHWAPPYGLQNSQNPPFQHQTVPGQPRHHVSSQGLPGRPYPTPPRETGYTRPGSRQASEQPRRAQSAPWR